MSLIETRIRRNRIIIFPSPVPIKQGRARSRRYKKGKEALAKSNLSLVLVVLVLGSLVHWYIRGTFGTSSLLFWVYAGRGMTSMTLGFSSFCLSAWDW
jgi:hypothetical protein